MATIGTFTANDNGSFTGIVETLTLRIKTLIRPVDKDSDKAPDFRLASSAIEYGAACSRPAARAVTISRSSWMIQASRLRSTPRWLRTTRLASTASSGRVDRK